MENQNTYFNNKTQLRSGVKRLTLIDFRNYPLLRADFNHGINIITGENGSGKTNILEALSFLTPGKGLRGAKLSEISRIATQKTDEYAPEYISSVNWAVSAKVEKNNEEFELGTAVEKNTDSITRSFDRRCVKINNQKISSQADLGKYFTAIWLTPQMERLFRGGSQPRRSFLDRLVYAFDIEHAKRIAQFDHLYKEWYQLIKSGTTDKHWLFSLEDSMASVGVAIAAARREQLAKLNTFIEKEPDDIFPSVVLKLEGIVEQKLDTLAAVDVEDFYRELLFNQRKNVAFDNKVDGINRTDFKVYYKKKNMPAEMCSTGEQKSLLISIILAQTKSQTLHQAFAPVLLLDEIAAHLDEEKKDALLNKILNLNLQAFITSVNKDLFSCLKNNADFFEVKNNNLEQII